MGNVDGQLVDGGVGSTSVDEKRMLKMTLSSHNEAITHQWQHQQHMTHVQDHLHLRLLIRQQYIMCVQYFQMGVSQGSVLGPHFFIILIKDFSCKLQVRLLIHQHAVGRTNCSNSVIIYIYRHILSTNDTIR